MSSATTAPVAIVTGGAKGIGAAISLALAGEGYRVVVADINTPTSTVHTIHAAGHDGIAVQCDVTVQASVHALIATTKAHYGGVDAMVCNAGIVKIADFLQTSEEDFMHVIDVNLKGTFLCGQMRLLCA